MSFEVAASVSNLYGAASALVLHLHLDRPSPSPNPINTAKRVLIWGASSSFGAYATQLATQAGYTVIGVASARSSDLVHSLGAKHFIDRNSPTVTQELVTQGPFEAVLAAADTAEDQVVLGNVLAAQGGGSFLSTMGLRPGVALPPGVSGHFAQYLDDYLDPKNDTFTKWLWWEYLETEIQSSRLITLPVRVVGGLDKVQRAWELLHEGKISGQRLIIAPDLD